MPETDTDGHYWEPEPESPLRQGDLLFNVPYTLLPSAPEFVVRTSESDDARLERFDSFPEWAPSGEIAVEARFGAQAMVLTPTCHVSEGEKGEDVVAIVPVEPLGVVAPRERWESIRQQKTLHLFHLPPTDLGSRLIPFEAVALLDRPSSLLKHELRQYRRLGLYRDYRFELRKKLASFWARASAAESLDRQLQKLTENDVPLTKIE